ncbi:DUF433 domain-containing protein [Salinarimonas ramus]|uniref:DUF433 domain-containing protein n=1 Tax=Salinarimonas ramus TaxID=690164 RepID=A0A917QIN0_9HYPH|nr:DUF433 domain-containing protein [Salinarimonas ramus]GGK52606.1 hypothetical protein GCM10011322_44380 [Salinarimonas ramus]
MSNPFIDMNEAILSGTPVIRGTRVTVYSVLGRVRHGETIDDLVADNPDISREAFEAAIDYATAHPERVRESFADALQREGYEPVEGKHLMIKEEKPPAIKEEKPPARPRLYKGADLSEAAREFNDYVEQHGIPFVEHRKF